eukprot:TRINITY_DN4857_c0_g1_i2.p1 TRINITY_DN4857_c0_g1~~TRINITY_DN4857_c0_g1_i2.p1  ORF type:complete len:425 (+),score=158.94 TRINITY_DN4857_c0_g1_i2:254-1528(+)
MATTLFAGGRLSDSDISGDEEGLAGTSSSSSTAGTSTLMDALREADARALGDTESIAEETDDPRALRRLITQLRDDKHNAELEAEQRLHSLKLAYGSEQQEVLRQLAALQQKQRELESQHPLLKERLRALREALQHTEVISDARAVELQAMPPDQLPLTDYVALRVYELVSTTRKGQEQNRRENDALKCQVRNLSDELKNEQVNLECALKSAQEAARRAVTERDAERERVHQLTAELEDKAAALEGMRPQASLTGSLRQELDKAQTKLRDAENKARSFASENGALKRSAEQAMQQAAQSDKKVELLELDKDFLAKQVEQLEARLTDCENRLARHKPKISSLKQQRDELILKLSAAQESPQQKYDERLNAEVSRMQRRYCDEATEARRLAQQSVDQQTQTLREVREEVMAQVKTSYHTITHLSGA